MSCKVSSLPQGEHLALWFHSLLDLMLSKIPAQVCSLEGAEI